MEIDICDIPENMDFSDYPDDTRFILNEHFPHYILEPFEVIKPDDPRYDEALTYNEVMQRLDD